MRRSEAPAGYAAGFRVTLPLIDMPRYLHHLAARVDAAGIPVELRPVQSLAEAAGEAPVVVNCAGVGARDLVPDPALRSVRGQHVVVENPGLDEFLMTEPVGPAWTSLFPHGERLILGSVAQEDNWNTAPRTQDAEAILERCAALEARVRDVQILDHRSGCGRRATSSASTRRRSRQPGSCTTTAMAAPASACRGAARARSWRSSRRRRIRPTLSKRGWP